MVASLIRAAAALSLACVLQQVRAHSWIDCLDTSRSKLYDRSAEYIFGGAKGNGFCDGYGAGFPGRGVADIGQMYTYKMLKDQVDAGAPICQTVDANTYTGWRKRLKAKAGVPIYYAYLPNGHIVKDKMGRGTKHGIYWTGKTDAKLQTTKDMTSDKLVDGKLEDYDDGNCGETLDSNGQPGGRAGDGKPCIGSFTIPAGTKSGTYHFVWYWKFYLEDGSYVDKERARGYFGASYTTCFEVEVEASGASGSAAQVAVTPAPAAIMQTPTVTPAKQTPAPTTKAPVATTKAPAATTKASAATTKAPTASTTSIDFSAYTKEQLNGKPTGVLSAADTGDDDEDDSDSDSGSGERDATEETRIKETWCT